MTTNPIKADEKYLGQIVSDDLLGKQRIMKTGLPKSQALLSALLGQQMSLFKHRELVFPDVLCAVQEMVAAQRAAGARGTPTAIPSGPFSAFTSSIQGPAVFTQSWVLVLGAGATAECCGSSGGRQALALAKAL